MSPTYLAHVNILIVLLLAVITAIGQLGNSTSAAKLYLF